MRTLTNFHPVVLLFYFVGTVLITMFTVHPVFLTLSFLGAICLAVALESFWIVLKSLGFYLLMILLIAVTNPIFSHQGVTILFSIGDHPITLESILYGLDVGGMIVSVLFWCRCYTHIVTSDQFIYLFGRAFPRLSLVLSLALRLVPLFIAQAKKIYQVQRTMGLYTTNSKLERLRGGLRAFTVVLTWSLENAVDTAASMSARGYGLPGRSSFALVRFTHRDVSALVLLSVLFFGTFWNMLGSRAAFHFYPCIDNISVAPLDMACYFIAIVVVFFPCVIEIKETLVWKYFR